MAARLLLLRYTFPVQQPSGDLTNITFDQFVSFLFDRQLSSDPKNDSRSELYHDVGIEFDARTVCAYYIRLFRRPGFLLTRFTKAQLEQGFWRIEGPVLECSVNNLIHDSDLSLAAREECIDSMADLFEHLFINEPLDTSVQMWWDALCYDWHCGNRKRERGGEDQLLQDIFFRTLGKVLAQDSWICQGAALHGLGHLHHPDTKSLIADFLETHPLLSKEEREYALAAADFKVL
jgi:hypothetical protein